MTKEIRHTFHISSSPESLANALSQVDEIQKWWTVEAKQRAAGGIFSWSSFGWNVEMTFEQIEKKLVVWKCIESNMQNTNAWVDSKMFFEFSSDKDGSVLSFSHSNYKSSPCYDICHKGWAFVLGKSLKSYLETGKGMPYTSDLLLDAEKPIVFNGKNYRFIRIEWSAQKHYQDEKIPEKIAPVFRSIFTSLNGQNRAPDIDSSKEQQKFTVASQTTAQIGFNQDQRSTRFKDSGEPETLSFFHSSPRRLNEFETKFTQDQKRRLE